MEANTGHGVIANWSLYGTNQLDFRKMRASERGSRCVRPAAVPILWKSEERMPGIFDKLDDKKGKT